MTESAVALDIVLLLPESAAARAHAYNATLRAAAPDGIRLDDTHLPHITLMQQCAPSSSLPAVWTALGPVLAATAPLELTVRRTSRLKSSAWFVIEPTPALQTLHERLLEALSPYADGRLAAAAFDRRGGEEPRPADLDWVRNYRAQSSGARFEPHVTLGVGEPEPLPAPFTFSATRVAACQLGRHCTARAVLREWTLTPPTG